MMVNALPDGKKETPSSLGRTRTAPVGVLQRHYAITTAALGPHFPMIDAWLAEHEPELWRQIRQEDDELFRLRALGISENVYQDRLGTLIELCKRAEQLYYEACPTELGLPPLAEGERVAIYCEFADGSFLKISDGEQ